MKELNLQETFPNGSTKVPNIWFQLMSGDTYEFTILAFLASFNPCIASYTYISEKLGISRKKVGLVIKSLKEKGLIKYKNR